MDTPVTQVDVLIAGGGTAGVIAAIQAGRLGRRALVLEMGSQLGGTMTTGGVSFPGLFHAWGRQVISGIGWELVRRAVELDSGAMPQFATAPQRHSQHQVHINGALYAALAEEACLDAGVQLQLHETAIAGKPTRTGWQIEALGKNVRRRVLCRQLVDCTGGADLVGTLGFPRLREEQTQPGTLMFALTGYDVSELDADAIQERYEQALEQDALHEGDFAHSQGRFIDFLASHGPNANHVFDADASTSVTMSQTNIRGRQALLRLLRFVRSLPGCGGARVLWAQPQTAVRETYRIVGQTQITHEDYTCGRRFEDAVCYSFYPIDLHTREGVKPEPLRPGVVPTVPLGALIPGGSRNLLVAGRSVSSDRPANSALRVQASAMAMGQAAGAAAALAAQHETTPGQVDMAELRRVLREHGAIVPG